MSSDEDIRSNIYQDNSFSKLHLSNGYRQIPVENGSCKYTDITTAVESFQFRQKMPFGIINSNLTEVLDLHKHIAKCTLVRLGKF